MKLPLRPGELRIERDARGAGHTLILSGELDLATAPQLETAILRLCGDGVSEVVLDLDQLSFVDSTGLRTILHSIELCARHDCDCHLTQGSPPIQQLFLIAGLRDALPFLPGHAALDGKH